MTVLLDGSRKGPPTTKVVAASTPESKPHIVWVSRWIASTGESGLAYWNPRAMKR